YDLTNQEIMRATVFYNIKCDYNRWRCHSAVGSLSSELFENQNLD
ncbi:TPA: IS3 family transposase, partial [Klebsiella pneumoniae]